MRVTRWPSSVIRLAPRPSWSYTSAAKAAAASSVSAPEYRATAPYQAAGSLPAPSGPPSSCWYVA
ncbi:hypothetical protein, partial [Micromonospora sp. 4G55]|uniref:hypothetical protein n=1 Tax=Micromonospora sp. 4G55 TaxID=2806102 RepID=UPI001A4D59D1